MARTHRHTPLLLGLGLLLALATGAAAAPADGGLLLVTPLLGWSSAGAWFAGDRTPEVRAVAQTTTDLASALGGLIAGALRPAGAAAAASPLLDASALADAPPEVALVLLGSRLRTSDLRRKHAAALQPLLEAAPSSVALPHVVHPVEGAPAREALLDALRAQLPAGAKLQTAGCGEGLALGEIAQLLLDGAPVTAEAPRLLVGCTDAAGGLEAELRQVAAAHGSVAALGKRQVTLYGVDPHAGEGGGGGGGAAAAEQRRRLLQAGGVTGGPYSVCDERCRTQVKWLEGMLALLLIIVATLSGLCCLSVLDTPTRFESPKDASRAD
ncbi:hypothetical protein Rsub_05904 [Raphidocelis subcapitata]|uniref:Uncharacterized protein n=1 Tax=Raphidocelis subcapitata TaxID=307507 RepID=A0A2V0P2Q2_9CHLO|nr:hypothetical protein Rsub_05904 [Raphidocelis subcapitata]|eukprot:GBF93172.1 hypothetical protein Rsub_05904 [Raphidocelis subcapitata]